MPALMKLYRKVAAQKGFLQYFRLLRNPSQLAGMCSGAAKIWLGYFFHSGSDTAFWAKYGAWRVDSDDYDAMIQAQRDPQNHSLGIKLHEAALMVGSHNDPRLWQISHGTALKYITITFGTNSHALAAYTPSPTHGHLFDPNVGQFDIGPTQSYKSFAELWSDLWDSYEITGVYVYSAVMKEVTDF